MEGSVYKRCGCRDASGRKLGTRCRNLQRQAKHGAWWARYDEPRGHDGRRRQTTLGPFDTRDMAQTELTKTLAKIHTGTYQSVDRGLTLATDLNRWLDGRIGLKPSTSRENRQIADLYLRPGLGHLRLGDLREHHIEDLYSAMRQIGRPASGKPSSTLRRLLEARTDTSQARRTIGRGRIRRVHAVLSAYLNSAVRRQVIPRNPADNVELQRGRATRALVWTAPRVTRWQQTGRRPSPVMVWTPEQAGAFLDSIVTDRLYPLFHLVAYRGLRRSEVLGLPWTDLDLDQATLAIRETLVDPDDIDADYLDFDDPKTTAGERVISLDTQTIAILRAWRRQQHTERLARGPAWIDSGRIFSKHNGQPLNPDTISQHFDRLITRTHRPATACTATTARGQQCQRQAVVELNHQPRCGLAAHGGHDHDAIPLRRPGIPPIRFHDLRHTAASLTYRATLDLKLVSALLGHSSTKITADIYTNIFTDVDRAAAEAVARLVPRSVLHPGAHPVHTTAEIGTPGL